MGLKKKSSLSRSCSVCSAPSASHLHYGAVTCYSCRAFFRRGIGKPYCCVEGTGDCNIDWTSRRSCQWCRFDKCLKVGMNPELVDASLRLKSLKSKKMKVNETLLIDNLQALEKSGIVSDVLRDISNEGQHNNFLHQPVETFLGDFGEECVYYLQGELLSEQEIYSTSFTTSPSNSSTLSPESSSTLSLESSSTLSLESSSTLSALSVFPSDEFPYIVAADSSDVQAGFDILMDDTRNTPESVAATEVQETVFCGNQASVIVRNISEHAGNTPYRYKESRMRKEYVEMTDAGPVRNNHDQQFAMSESDDEEDEMKAAFDIETLVEECFLHINEEGLS